MQTDVPVLDIDPFAEEFQRDPDPFHERLREAGPVVYLDRYRVWAVARYTEVHAVLRDYERFCSAAGVGLANFWHEEPWRSPSLLVEADPPAHTRPRRITTRAMSPRAIERLRPGFERHAEEAVAAVVARGRFDGVTDLAQAYLLRAFPEAFGLAPGGGEKLLRYGDMAFNLFGPRNEIARAAMAAGMPLHEWFTEQCRRGSLRADGLGAAVYSAVDRGEATEDEAGLLVRSLISAGLDSTIDALSWTLYLLAVNPDQWAALRDDPALARAAFDEALRYYTPVQHFFRTTTGEVRLAGAVIPAKEKVLCFLGAANRDPRRWERPDRFDIRRRAAPHLALGTGIHSCVGAATARFEAEGLLTALARQVRTLELAGPPRPRRHNVLRSLANLPLEVHAA
ncbi:cytochrome P450 [Actinosynnema sp. NPDC047251]|uniref:Cytochrome P450 family protein n=1 Tax=Saccharothrix espanaensis (strain ATCC 51144 / DSM 44229 / JCM 9112 / NBRC 15066 / NRRL 15764) TaxID=1179773 RepID=K0K5A8_SACES|nr:cytochrome P450 [Saccharothrix espanaensis]CCH32772.1 Cytochrome P450 family protein [Saccharothrix espanaensis DSM 44229]